MRGSLRLKKPISAQMLEHSEKRIDNGTESLMTTELVGADGARYVYDGLVRWIETDTKINRIMTVRTRRFASKDDATPSNSEVTTILADTTKGEVEGDNRWDITEYTLVNSEGVHKSPAFRHKRSILSGSTKRSEQEVLDQVISFLNLK
jgi:hypothetical protein